MQNGICRIWRKVDSHFYSAFFVLRSEFQECQGDHGRSRANYRCCLPALAGFVSPQSMGPGATNVPESCGGFKKNQKSEVRSQRSEVRGQRSEVRGPKARRSRGGGTFSTLP